MVRQSILASPCCWRSLAFLQNGTQMIPGVLSEEVPPQSRHQSTCGDHGFEERSVEEPQAWACMVAVIEESLPILRASGHPTPTKADVLAELATVLDAASNRRKDVAGCDQGGSNGDRGAEWDDRAYSNRDGHPCTAQSNPHDAHSIDVGDCSRSRLRCKPMFILRSQLRKLGSTSRPEPCS